MRTQALGLSTGVAFLSLMGWTHSISMLVCAMICVGYCKGIYESNLWAALHDVVRPEVRASAVGIMNSLGWLGGGIAPLAIAAASQHFGMSACLSAISLVYAASAGLLLWNAGKVSSAHVRLCTVQNR